MSKLIIRLAVEEEARIMLLVIQIAKEESIDSTKIMQGHNWVVDFLQYIFWERLKTRLIKDISISSNKKT
jgi:hypothetical protein